MPCLHRYLQSERGYYKVPTKRTVRDAMTSAMQIAMVAAMANFRRMTIPKSAWAEHIGFLKREIQLNLEMVQNVEDSGPLDSQMWLNVAILALIAWCYSIGRWPIYSELEKETSEL